MIDAIDEIDRLRMERTEQTKMCMNVDEKFSWTREETYINTEMTKKMATDWLSHIMLVNCYVKQKYICRKIHDQSGARAHT